MNGTCDGCGKTNQWLMPIHGDKGGRCGVFSARAHGTRNTPVGASGAASSSKR
jgi:hypothetical protein